MRACLAPALALLLAAPTAWAANSASIECGISSTGLNFGNYQPGQASQVFGAIGLSCREITPSPGAEVAVHAILVVGASANNSGAQRRMRHAGQAAYLSYDLFQSGTSCSGALLGTWTGNLKIPSDATSVTEPVPYCARIPAGQTSAPAGSYGDLIPLTLTF